MSGNREEQNKVIPQTADQGEYMPDDDAALLNEWDMVVDDDDASLLNEWDMVVDDADLHLDNASAALADYSFNLAQAQATLGSLSQQMKEAKDRRAAELLWAWSYRLSGDIARLSEEVSRYARTQEPDVSALAIILPSKLNRCLFRANYNKKECKTVAAKLDDILGTTGFESWRLSGEELDRLVANWQVSWDLLKSEVVFGTRAKAALLQCLEVIETEKKTEKA
ncbi:hypothetical protein UCREL1_11124 [Eutypa lata UCREL1]|uniref:Uncharacterized protein n=1 Tax=Eutypa lata (strain UCR-EL1) TaxID=1287681 RepID=M7T5M6_EUTLA|nr:hypothetical protein UCREL1_11124 [Eutypa lata UCREL1]